MIDNLEYLSARTLHQINFPDKYLQGTGTIIASQGKYFLVTALHCMRQLDDEGNEIVSPDWKKMKGTIYLKDREVDLEFKSIVDADDINDWAILEIEKPNNGFEYEQSVILTDEYNMQGEFQAYGYPHSVADGMYLDFMPANKRGCFWRLKEMVEGGSTKAITAEKGCSGMGLFYEKDGKYCCLGIINKTAPGGDFNVMQLMSITKLRNYFPDLFKDHNKQDDTVMPTDDELGKQIEESGNVFSDLSDQELSQQYVDFMELSQYKDAREPIETLWKRHPEDEWATLNYIRVLALTAPSELKKMEQVGLEMNYSNPQAVVFAARTFAKYGYPQTAVDIWYNNALKFNDNELDTLFYVELLGSPMSKIVYKEYDDVTEGKCVLYADEQDRRHCLIASDKTLMARTMLGHKKDDEIELNIAGEERKVVIIAIHDKYYSLVHRALHDVMEQGGNSIMKPFKIGEQKSGEEFLKAFCNATGIDPTRNVDQELQDEYNTLPWLLNSCKTSDVLWGYYRLLFSDFKLMACPIKFKNKYRFEFITPSTRFILDLSSLLVLFEKSCNGTKMPQRKFIISNFMYEYIKEYKLNVGWHISYEMNKVLSIGKIHKFSDNGREDVELRYDALLRWMDEYCIRESSPQLLQANQQLTDSNDLNKMYMSTMTLLLDEENSVLVTEDWYFNLVYKGDVPIFDAAEIIAIG